MSRERIIEYFGINYVIAEASGVDVVTAEGKPLVDALSQYGALPFGSNFKPFLSQVKGFFDSKSPTLVQPFTASSVLEAKKKLICMLGEDRFSHVIFANSGAESIEAAVKIVRSRTGKPGIIALKNSFHGKTMAAVQLTSNPQYRDYFCIENDFVRHIDIEAELTDIEESIRHAAKEVQASAFVIELVQGEGGMHALNQEKISHAVKVAKDLGLYIIVDEIQTGLGRTGSLFSFQEYAIDPDIVLLGKALAGGVVSLSACVATAEVVSGDFTIFHSSTFSNNNFSSYVCNIVLDLLNEELLDNVRQRSEQLESVLARVSAQYPEVYAKYSGRGLMRGIHLKGWNDLGSFFSNTIDDTGLIGYAAAAWLIRNRGLITMPCFSTPTCIRVQPPLIVTEKEIDKIARDLSALADMLLSPGGYANLFVLPDNKENNQKEQLKSFPLLRSASPRVTTKNGADAEGNRQIKVRNKSPDGRFTFVIHPIDNFSFERTFPDSYYELSANRKDLFRKSAREILKIMPNIVASCYSIEALSLGDKLIEGNFVTLSLFPDELMGLSADDRRHLLTVIGQEVTRIGPDVLGLGAFSSILAKGGYSLRHLDMTVTAGSSLTAAAAMDVVWFDSFTMKHMPRFGIVGPGGSVGLRVWQFLLYQILQTGSDAEICLLYNPGNPHAIKTIEKYIKLTIDQLFDVCACEQDLNISSAYKTRITEIRKIFYEENSKNDSYMDRARYAFGKVLGFPVLSIAASNDRQAVCEIDSLVVATDSSQPLDLLLAINPECKVYDLGRPHSFDSDHLKNNNVEIYEAGLVSLPNSETTFGSFNMCGLPAGVSLGCLAETMVLAASGDELRPPSYRGTFLHSLQIFERSRTLGMTPVAFPIGKEIIQAKERVKVCESVPCF